MMADGSIVYQVTVDDKGALQSIKQIGTSAKDAGQQGSEGFDGMASKIKNLAKVIAASMVVKQILDIGKAALTAYADFEQLNEGAKLMFGGAYDFIAEKAADAYKNVQMSQNDYLRQVNQFAVGLRESLGGDEQAAAELADRIVTAEADIVAATGVSSEAVQNAFAGIMRGNYTMLDSLGIGLKGSQEGMQEVIDKMNEINGTEYEFGNLADMQNALADYVEYIGFAGYAANEGAETLQGATATMAAAWENLLVGIAGGSENTAQLVQNLLTSATTYVGLVIPVIGNIIMGFINSLPAMLDGILTMVVGLIGNISDSMPTLIDNLIVVLTNLITTVLDHIPDILAAGVQLIIGLGSGLIQAIPKLISNIPTIISSLFTAIVNGVGSMISAGIELLTGVKTGSENAGKNLLDWFAGLPRRILSALGNLGSLLWNAGSSIINGLLNGIKSAFEGVKNFVGGIGSWIQEHKGPEDYDKHLLVKQGEWIMQSLAAGLESGRGDVYAALQGISADIAGYSMTANLAPVGVGSSTTIVNVNGMTASNPNVMSAGANLASEIMLDLRMGMA